MIEVDSCHKRATVPFDILASNRRCRSSPAGETAEPLLSKHATILGLIPYKVYKSLARDSSILARLCPTTPNPTMISRKLRFEYRAGFNMFTSTTVVDSDVVCNVISYVWDSFLLLFTTCGQSISYYTFI